MLVLRSIVDQEQEADGWEALDQSVQEHLGLRIDPVEVLKDDQEWLVLSLA